VQPTGDLGSIYSYRNGNEILVFGSSKDDINILFFKLVKLDKGEDSVSIIGRK
jgi:hypothetical protein